MNPELKEAFRVEIERARNQMGLADLGMAFRHLERAHIIGQSYVIPHTMLHIWMLRIGVEKRDFKEIIGQVFRIVAAVLFSRVWVPIGNTGGANVNAFKPMPVPEDLKQLLGR